MRAEDKNIALIRKRELQRRKLDATSPVSLTGILLTIFIVGLSFVSMHSVFIMVFGMLPGFVAMMVDKEYDRYLTKIVFCFNITGTAPYVMQLLFQYNVANSAALRLIMDPQTWMYIYTYSAIGWVVYWVCPSASIILNSLQVQFKMFELNNELNKLSDEWGEELRKPN